MLSSRLIQLIEDHSEQLGGRVLHRVLRDPRLLHLAKLSEADLQARAHDIARNLGHWLLASSDAEHEHRFEDLGRRRWAEGVPLSEVVLAQLHVKTELLAFVRGQGIGQSTVEIYGQEELEYRVSQFFDHMIYHVIRGYETSLRERHS